MIDVDTTYARFRDARLVELLKVETNEGAGEPDDPIRRVAYYVEPKTGKVLFKLGETIERKFAGEDQMYS